MDPTFQAILACMVGAIMDPTFQAILACMVGAITVATLTAIGLKIWKSRRVKDSQRTIIMTSADVVAAVDEYASFHSSLQISMSDILAATKNFSPDLIIEYNRFGSTYRAELSNGPKLSIKRLAPNAFQGFMEFRSELEILGKLRHRNVVRILGYCVSGGDRILIYELFEEGHLGLYLRPDQNDTSYSRRLPLSWETRYKIVAGVANGLAYMHDLDKPIIHRDVKPSIVLLDSEFEAHISDFGLARTMNPSNTHVSTQAAGTSGYMPPEYEDGLTRATMMGDVYSVGILMLEVATGMRPDLAVVLNGRSTCFAKWAGLMVVQNREREILDPNIWDCASRRGLEKANIKEYFRACLVCYLRIVDLDKMYLS
ncbi:Tyrosine-protein kinase [Trema orientale]|uniref:non-specific serine/threonine protein kinase n=1 Tax=Trema orientale TaxID=63057 RepID=A0A2P5B659_TREOI|nr:Tyrosine-protein kinase [Trema orientale]